MNAIKKEIKTRKNVYKINAETLNQHFNFIANRYHVITQSLHYKQDAIQGQIFKRSTAGLTTEFSFSYTSGLTEVKEPYLSKDISAKWNTNSHIQDLNTGCRFHFLWWLVDCLGFMAY